MKLPANANPEGIVWLPTEAGLWALMGGIEPTPPFTKERYGSFSDAILCRWRTESGEPEVMGRFHRALREPSITGDGLIHIITPRDATIQPRQLQVFHPEHGHQFTLPYPPNVSNHLLHFQAGHFCYVTQDENDTWLCRCQPQAGGLPLQEATMSVNSIDIKPWCGGWLIDPGESNTGIPPSLIHLPSWKAVSFPKGTSYVTHSPEGLWLMGMDRQILEYTPPTGIQPENGTPRVWDTPLPQGSVRWAAVPRKDLLVGQSLDALNMVNPKRAWGIEQDSSAVAVPLDGNMWMVGPPSKVKGRWMVPTKLVPGTAYPKPNVTPTVDL